MPDQFGNPLPGEGAGALPGVASYAPGVNPGLRAVPGGLPQPNPALGNQGMAQALSAGGGPSPFMNNMMNQMGQARPPGMPVPGGMPGPGMSMPPGGVPGLPPVRPPMPPGGGMLGQQPPSNPEILNAMMHLKGM